MKLHLKILILTVLLGFFQKSYADTFIVTSNADSGPGTLREAITLANANGTAVTDYINFNISDVSIIGRTITILSTLPALSSKILIDATTQPGTKLGLSDAKVILQMTSSTEFNQKLFVIEHCNGIEIYGFKITDRIVHFTYQETRCFYIYESENIIIGDALKGNVILNWTYGIQIESQTAYNKNFRISGNFIGLNEDGETPEYNYHSVLLNRIENFTFGGPTSAHGNHIASAGKRVEISGGKGVLHIENNKIGCNYSGTIALSLPYGESSHLFDNIAILNSPWYNEIDYDTEIKVLKNLLTGTCRSGIYILGYGKKFYIQGNTIGTDVTGQFIMNDFMDFGIRIENSRYGIIGVENNDSEKNIIAFAKRGSGSETHQAGSAIAIANTQGVTISRNSIFCDNNKGINFDTNSIYRAPIVTINQVDANSISGHTSPHAKIEFFRDDNCTNCEGKDFLNLTTIADASGNWSLSNVNTNNIVVTATGTDGQTSEFSSPAYKANNLIIRNATCGRNNGQISGINITSGTRWQWIDANGNVAGTDTTLKNAAPGIYHLVVGIGSNNCSISSQEFEIKNQTVPDLSPGVVLTPASCGLGNGSILINDEFNQFKITWLNATGDSIATGNSVIAMFPGTYYLKLAIPFDTSCNKTYGPYTIGNLTGPSLNLNNITNVPATCNNSNGSIQNIGVNNVNGTPFIQWLDSLNNPVGNSLDLLNVPAGKYRLKFKDESGCDTIITPYYTIGNTGTIAIDTIGKIITASSCTAPTGTIQNIKVTGATGYQWRNTATNNIAGNSLLLSGIAPGNYQLTATNTTGCSATSPVINVPPASFSPISVTGSQVNNATCAETNGSISLTGFSTNASAYSFKWINKTTSQFIGSGTTINNLEAGSYAVLATDINGCEKEIFSTTLQAFPKPTFDLTGLNITDDKCSLQQGSITGIKINGLIGSGTTYTWKDQNNTTVSSSLFLQNIEAGNYSLTVTDGGNCTIQSLPFTVNNNDNAGVIPQYDNLTIPRFTAATLTVKNPQSGTYYLYSDAAGTQLLQQNNTGVFTTIPLPANTDFYVKHVTGTCSSALTNIKVTVVDKSYFVIPSAFTPNSDGKNDKLNLKVLGYIEVEYFKIYNRNGEQVFTTKTVNDGWNGIYRGSLQPSSVFVWVAKGKDLLGNVIEQNGTFVLIR